MTWSKEWAKWPEYLWGIAELLLFCFSILGALVLIVLALLWLFFTVREFIEDKWWDFRSYRRRKKTADRKQYEKQGGPW